MDSLDETGGRLPIGSASNTRGYSQAGQANVVAPGTTTAFAVSFAQAMNEAASHERVAAVPDRMR